MVWPRYLVYFAGVTLVTWLLTQAELTFPGFLDLYVPAFEGDPVGTSEYSPVETLQLLILCACGSLLAWVAHYCPSQRPIAVPFGGLALVFLIRECGFFLDRYVADNLWQALIVAALALIIVYTFRVHRRLRIAWARIWPSPGLALWFAGAVILFSFIPLVGHEALWQSILGSGYLRVAKLAVEELTELLGYFLWLIGTIEYTYQARAIAYRKPQPAAFRRRQKRRHDHEGRY